MKKRFRTATTVGAFVLATACGIQPLTSYASVTLNVFTDPHPTVGGGTIGFTYAGNKFVGSVQADGNNVLYSTDLNGGNVQVFAPTVFIPGGSPSSEHFVSSSLGLGGFPNRDVYVAAGNSIIHIDNAGTTSNTFVSGLASAVRGITFDTVGTFGNDMLVTTIGGQIYRVDSLGSPTLLASVGEDTEGLDVAPLGAGFGGKDGQLIVASEGSGNIRAISNTGVATTLITGIPGGPEELTFVPLNLGASGNPVEGFYGSNYTQNVLKADASQFTGFLGDAIVTTEFSHQMLRLHWNGAAFDVTTIGTFPNQPEDGLFVTAAIINPTGTVPEPSALLLLGSGLAGLAYWRRRLVA